MRVDGPTFVRPVEQIPSVERSPEQCEGEDDSRYSARAKLRSFRHSSRSRPFLAESTNRLSSNSQHQASQRLRK